MTAEYPNLPLLEYIFKQSLRQLQVPAPYSIDAYVFPQTWPNTACGFSEPGMISGQAFTKDYTTVMFCETLALVCFGNQPAYLINNPNKAFMDDFNDRNMKTKYNAERVYKDGKEEETERA